MATGNSRQIDQAWLIFGVAFLLVGLSIRLGASNQTSDQISTASPAAAMAQADRARVINSRADSLANGESAYSLEIETGQ